MDFFFGIIGFLGFELLRIYKCLIGNAEPIPKNHIVIYIITLCLLSLLSGFLAFLLAENNIIRALLLGFSLPTGFKALLHPTRRDYIGDIEKPKIDKIQYFWFWLILYFKFG